MVTVHLTTDDGWEFFGAQFVDPANGSDSNRGRSPGRAKATIAAAVGDTPPGGGYVILAPFQNHDIGDGLSLDRRHPITFQNPFAPPVVRRMQANRPSSNPRIFSSTGAATLVNFRTPASVVNGYGFTWEGIDFIPSPTTTKIFDAPAMNMMRILRCAAYHDYDDTIQNPFQFIDAPGPDSLGDDVSWWRVVDSYVRGGTLLKAGDGTSNLNQWVIKENICHPTNATGPMIEMSWAHRCYIGENNLEGDKAECGVKLTEGSRGNTIVGDGGEQTDPFIIIDGAHGNTIIPVGNSDQTGEMVLVQFLNGATDNLVVASVATGMANLPYDHAGWIDDQTTNKDNWVFGSSGNKTAANGGFKQRVLALSDAKFAPNAVDGKAFIYVDSADGDLKVTFGDGTVKTLATDT